MEQNKTMTEKCIFVSNSLKRGFVMHVNNLRLVFSCLSTQDWPV